MPFAQLKNAHTVNVLKCIIMMVSKRCALSAECTISKKVHI
jgi:hypothetical protein